MNTRPARLRRSMRGPALAGLGMALVLALAGCAGGPRYHEIMAVAPPVADQARIVVLRPAERFLDYSSSPAVVRMNDQRIGRLSYGGFFYKDLPPGPVSIRVSSRNPLSGTCRLALEAVARETLYLEVAPRSSNRLVSGIARIVGGTLAVDAVLDPAPGVGAAFPVEELVVDTVGGEIAGTVGSAAEATGQECAGPFELRPLAEEEALQQLRGLDWSE